MRWDGSFIPSHTQILSDFTMKSVVHDRTPLRQVTGNPIVEKQNYLVPKQALADAGAFSRFYERTYRNVFRYTMALCGGMASEARRHHCRGVSAGVEPPRAVLRW